jgi:hypothetical protein
MAIVKIVAKVINNNAGKLVCMNSRHKKGDQ